MSNPYNTSEMFISGVRNYFRYTFAFVVSFVLAAAIGGGANSVILGVIVFFAVFMLFVWRINSMNKKQARLYAEWEAAHR